MGYVAFIAILLWLSCWLAIYATGSSLRDDIRREAPALESVVFPVLWYWVLTFPFFSPFNVLAVRVRILKLRPEFAPQFNRFRASMYLWLASFVAVIATIYLAINSS